MGWRGTLRTIVAAERRAARAGVQRQKLAAKRDAALQKLNQINEAAAEVQGAEEYQTSLLSLHTRSAPTIDWKTLAHGPKPNPPPASHSEEIAAREKRAGYSPSWPRQATPANQKAHRIARPDDSDRPRQVMRPRMKTQYRDIKRGSPTGHSPDNSLPEC